MNGAQITYICDSFGMSHKDLAKALNVSTFTVKRWTNDKISPKGIHIEVLDGLLNVLLKVKDTKKRYEIGTRLKLGIGALIYMGLRDIHSGK